MKTFLKISHILILFFLIGCNNDDNEVQQMEEETPIETSLTGSWEASSTSTFNLSSPFLVIEETEMFLLNENDLGFRTERNGSYERTENSIFLTIDEEVNSFTYTLEENNLVLTNSTGETANFFRRSTPVNTSTWITDLEIITQNEAPYNQAVDITIRDGLLLFPNGSGEDGPDIVVINTEGLDLAGFLPDSIVVNAFAIEVEKFDGDDQFLFMGDELSDNIKVYRNDNAVFQFEITSLISRYTGLASVNNQLLFVSQNSGSSLTLINYAMADGIVYNLDTLPTMAGLDYKNDFLYICALGNIYKCQVSLTEGSLQVIASYALTSGLEAIGITSDDTNFYINARVENTNNYQLLKINLAP